MSLPDPLDDTTVLECECDNCHGEGGWFSNGGYGGEWTYCGICDGAGHIPTEIGRKILSLVRHNMPNLTGKVD